jgi:hypothetical protein
MQTQVAKCALEWWRASGTKTEDRLRALVAHFAETNNETERVAYHIECALAAVRYWEWR